MSKGTTPVGGVESVMINGAGAEIARNLGLPSHAYMALTDSKTLDYQGGMETSMGAVVAALGAVNNVSGPGMHNFQTTQSMEKLILDNEIALMALHLRRGIGGDDAEAVAEVVSEGVRSGSFLTLAHTLSRFREEAFFPGTVIDRGAAGGKMVPRAKEILERARKRKTEILEGADAESPAAGMREELEEVMLRVAWRTGMKKLPELQGGESG
jgi:trimethylamine--corrinoid protein Co-methyltransferase